MSSSKNQTIFKNLGKDLPASIVVFFVALPLCLAIAIASGAEPFSGLIAGIIGGIIVGSMSGSQIGVSGPAAGLAAIVASAILVLGFETFLVAVVLAGVIQILFGILGLGIIGYYFPSSVIKGMLSGIGIFIILKEIPHFFGNDENPILEFGTYNTFSEWVNAFTNIGVGSTTIAFIALGILILWEAVLMKKSKVFKLIQGPVVAVLAGILFYVLTKNGSLSIGPDHLVTVPVPKDIESFFGQFQFPEFAAIGNVKVWITAATIALVASLETLLCVEATDKLDPEKRVTPTNRELIAQGTGNIFSGLIGGLPITQVIVRSSANVHSGGKTKFAAIFHGFLLLVSVILIPTFLNLIPLSVLAAVLLIVGFKLAKPALFVEMYRNGWKQFVPYVVTILGIVCIDLLWGIGLGLVVGVVIVLLKSYQNSHFLHMKDVSNGKTKIKMELAEEVTFINKGAILKELNSLPDDSFLEIDVRKTRFLDYDIIEILEDFIENAKSRNINFRLISEKGEMENPDKQQLNERLRSAA